jgi:hypothetical protein
LVAAYVADLERLVSKPRLERYRPPNRDDLETAVAYLWNVALSEALLQGLSAVEVGLRNSIHNVLTAHAGTDMWFWAILESQELKTINDTWLTLAKRHKQPPTSGKIVAELTFGFWPLLFGDRYHSLWWNNSAALLKAVFLHTPPGLPPARALTPRRINERVETFKDLRNRVMHHEPIYFGLTRLNLAPIPLPQLHAEMVEMLNWIDPQLAVTLNFVDRFDDVHRDEQNNIRDRLNQKFNIS